MENLPRQNSYMLHLLYFLASFVVFEKFQDPDLIYDLRVNNNGRPQQYDEFLAECQAFINSSVDTAVDDRRHDNITDDGIYNF